MQQVNCHHIKHYSPDGSTIYINTLLRSVRWRRSAIKGRGPDRGPNESPSQGKGGEESEREGKWKGRRKGNDREGTGGTGRDRGGKEGRNGREGRGGALDMGSPQPPRDKLWIRPCEECWCKVYMQAVARQRSNPQVHVCPAAGWLFATAASYS